MTTNLSKMRVQVMYSLRQEHFCKRKSKCKEPVLGISWNCGQEANVPGNRMADEFREIGSTMQMGKIN